MKRSTVLLAATVAANVTLVAVMLKRPAPVPAAPPASSSPPAASPAGQATVPGRATSNAIPSPDEVDGTATVAQRAAPSAHELAALLKGDPRDVIARLRAAGYSQEFVAAVAQAMISDELADKQKALGGTGEIPPFWSGTASTTALVMDPAVRALNSEMNRRFLDLLGADAYSLMDPTQEQRQFGDLPADKIAAVRRAMAEYNQRLAETMVSGMQLPEDREKMLQLEKDRRAAIVAALSPQELEDYDLRNSSAASQLRSRLTGMNATEDEFKALHRLQHAFNEAYALGLPNPTPEFMAARNAGQQKLNQDIQSVLSPDRYAEYQLVSSTNYQMLNQLVQRLELPAATTRPLAQLQKDFQDRATALRQSPELTAEVRSQRLAELATEARERIEGMIGSRGLQVYQINSPGSWLVNLVPPPPLQPNR